MMISLEMNISSNSELKDVLFDLFNKSLNSLIFPDALKMAKITTIFKTGDETFLTTYRPISVLSEQQFKRSCYA